MPNTIYIRDDGDDGIELTSSAVFKSHVYTKWSAGWLNCNNVKPPINEPILVFRSCVISDDLTDKPIKIAIFDGKKYDCHHQPELWMHIKKPTSWDDALDYRQKGI